MRTTSKPSSKYANTQQPTTTRSNGQHPSSHWQTRIVQAPRQGHRDMAPARREFQCSLIWLVVPSRFLLPGGGTSGCQPPWSPSSPYKSVPRLDRLLSPRHVAGLEFCYSTRRILSEEKTCCLLWGSPHEGGTGIPIAGQSRKGCRYKTNSGG